MHTLVITITILVVVLLLLIMLGWEVLYLRIARNYNLTAKVTSRSAHSYPVVTGGGSVFYFTTLVYQIFCWCNLLPPNFNILGWAFGGITLLAIISFLDDIYDLSPYLRMLVQFIGASLIALQLNFFDIPWYYCTTALIAIVGFLNIYNFMDGITGMLMAYSTVVLLSLLFVSETFYGLIIFLLLSLVIFGIFNFRSIPLCFSGDIGSIVMGALIIFILFSSIIESLNITYIMFVSVYAVDGVCTIIYRLIKRQNILQAHHLHIYQLLSRIWEISQFRISIAYASLQLVISTALLLIPTEMQPSYSIGVLFALCSAYVYIRYKTNIIQS